MPKFEKIEITFRSFSNVLRVAEGERSVVAIVSSPTVDCMSEVLLSEGCISKRYEKNPVLLLSHNAEELPVGRCDALKRSPEKVEAKFVFAPRPDGHPADSEWLPDIIFSLYQHGTLNAFSVGFIPRESRVPNKVDVQKYPGVSRIISKWELLEISCVTIPANEDAVATAVSKGYLTEAQAKRLFTVEEKGPARVPTEEDLITCSECGGKFLPRAHVGDYDDEKQVCRDCKEKRNAGKAADPVVEKIAVEQPAEEPIEQIAIEIENKSHPEEVVILILEPPRMKVNPKYYDWAVEAAIQKERGQIYYDDEPPPVMIPAEEED